MGKISSKKYLFWYTTAFTLFGSIPYLKERSLTLQPWLKRSNNSNLALKESRNSESSIASSSYCLSTSFVSISHSPSGSESDDSSSILCSSFSWKGFFFFTLSSAVKMVSPPSSAYSWSLLSSVNSYLVDLGFLYR